MRIELLDFQIDAVSRLLDDFDSARRLSATHSTALLLNAPTGAGKTLMMTSFIERLLNGDEDGRVGDDEVVFLWLTDDPELNLQSKRKLLQTSSHLSDFNVRVIDATFDQERFTGGNVYFLNTQKLGRGGRSYITTGDGRAYSLWETIQNTIVAEPTRFVVIIDEAHRGARPGVDENEANTIMQKFVVGNGDVSKVPLIVGVSATPGRFTELCTRTNRPLFSVGVDPADVRESGLLKDYVDLFHPDEDEQPSAVTMLHAAIEDWRDYTDRWAAYAIAENVTVKPPVLLVQVEDAPSRGGRLSATDLDMVVGVLSDKVCPADVLGLAHAFQDGEQLTAAGRDVRRVAPSDIDADPDVKAVIFKTSLNTGWDCPRAEVLLSFRTARDETNIAQLVGRMVRSPLARRIDSDEHLNSVSLYLPNFDQTTVKTVVNRLTGQSGGAVQTRQGRTVLTLHRTPGFDECFAALSRIPTYVIPRSRTLRPVPRLAKLASLLAELGFETDPTITYRTGLVDVLERELRARANDATFKALCTERGLLDVRRERLTFSTGTTTGTRHQVQVADVDLNRLFEEAGRTLGEALHTEWLRRALNNGEVARTAKLQLAALVATPDVLTAVDTEADRQLTAWLDDHRTGIQRHSDEARRKLRDIDGSSDQPTQTTITPPQTIESTTADPTWDKHLYSQPDGQYQEKFSSWEGRVLDTELARTDIIGWLRNPDRKDRSLAVPRQDGTGWKGIYPDLLFFRQTASGVIVDVIDPHLLNDEYVAPRAQALAQYINNHGSEFGRFEMVLYDGPNDQTGKRLDLTKPNIRQKVANVTTPAHLRALFDTL